MGKRYNKRGRKIGRKAARTIHEANERQKRIEKILADLEKEKAQ